LENEPRKLKAGKLNQSKASKRGYRLVIGVDEAGRGPLAGPVVAAAVNLKTNRFKNRIDDSKKLTSRARERAFFEIIHKSKFGIGIVNELVIDRINIYQATRLAMEQAIAMLAKKLEPHALKRTHVLVDGIMKLNTSLPYISIIRGDSKYKSIAAASILAKVIRDRIMSLYDRIYPQYGFLKHKGYSTSMHRAALKKFGPSLIHRKSFSCV